MGVIVVELDESANGKLISKLIENIKGVVRASFKSTPVSFREEYHNVWVDKMMKLSNEVDNTVIDTEDERTKYLLSK